MTWSSTWSHSSKASFREVLLQKHKSGQDYPNVTWAWCWLWQQGHLMKLQSKCESFVRKPITDNQGVLVCIRVWAEELQQQLWNTDRSDRKGRENEGRMNEGRMKGQTETKSDIFSSDDANKEGYPSCVLLFPSLSLKDQEDRGDLIN